MLWQIVVLGIALGMNNALASVALGTSKIKRSKQMQVALMFAVFEALMPIIGLFLGDAIAHWVGNKARFLGIGVLAVLGLYFFFKAKDDEDKAEGEVQNGLPGFKSLLLALALSLDNLTVGFGLGMLQVPIVLAAVSFGIISLVMTYVGLEVGRYLGDRISVSADKMSGVVLLAVAGLMLLLHT